MSCVFLATRKSETGLLSAVVVLLVVFQTCFLSPGIQESVSSVSFKFLNGKKIEWVLIIRDNWYPWTTFKMKRSFVTYFQFSKKNLRRIAAGRFSKFPDAQQRFYREMNSIKFFGGSHFTFWCNLAGIALNFSKSCSMDNEPPRPLLASTPR